MDTIVITIPWAVVVAAVLLAIAITAFLVAFFLWMRSKRRQERLATTAASVVQAGATAGPAVSAAPVKPTGTIAPIAPAVRHYCPQCGAAVQLPARFCVRCGTALGE